MGCLINKGVIEIQQLPDSDAKEIPPWIRNDMCGWSDGSIPDNEFVAAITFLVKNGLVKP